ncbi:sigma factor-like helix-turn-helix DNA-binding protein [Wukongibacter sp. M2B1]|uniref:sigma factor-like helix-turn-helix DNA-binding protein n=1 Tax=Wukongibacter sp. M2B1 TaxID=3088895 RepID=UPI003D7BEDA8
MTNRKIDKKIEDILYRYFRKKRSLDRMYNRVSILENKIERIKKDIHECNIEIKDNLRAIDYDRVNVQVSEIKSIVEESIISSIENLQRELSYTHRKKVKLKIKIRELEEKTSEIDNLLKGMTEQELQIIEMKYNDRFTNVRIAKLTHCSERTVRRKKDEFIEYIACELNIS